MTNWVWPDPPKTPVITEDAILRGGAPVVLVTHDARGDWQFLGSGERDMATARVVALLTITAFDPTLTELADLPCGWRAWRQTREHAWQRGPKR